jgi:hypothetical protein
MGRTDQESFLDAGPEDHEDHKSRRGRHRKRRPIRRIVLLVILIALIPLGWSYFRAVTAPGIQPLGARTVEWIKETIPGGRPAVLWFENFWYRLHPPPVGGTPSGGIPVESQGPTTSPGAHAWTPAHLPAPPNIKPIASPALPNEGVWQPIGKKIYGQTTMYAAFMRPDTTHTSLLEGLVWMDPSLLRGVLVPGTQNPGGTPPPQWGAMVPKSARGIAAATFNSGFLMQDANGGWYSMGHMVTPLVNGDASLVFYKDGTMSVGVWGSSADFKLPNPNIVQVRQNLAPIVQNGQLAPDLGATNYQKWGATLGNAVLVWRSGIGVTQDGALVYAGGPGLSVWTLANLLKRAGAVTAMELDINTYWVQFNYYTNAPNSPYGTAAQKLLNGMYSSPYRYLVPDQRDFIAMFLRNIQKPGTASASPTPSASPSG